MTSTFERDARAHCFDLAWHLPRKAADTAIDSVTFLSEEEASLCYYLGAEAKENVCLG